VLDQNKQQKKHDELSDTFNMLSNKYEAAVKEKMLMKLEKDRLTARVENLDLSLNQLSEDQVLDGSLSKSKHDSSIEMGKSATKQSAAAATMA